ncbi:MAG: hypothetical protein QOK29_5052 [Rhodospirillaceae bacterium]|jgi:hypothetical protein|nr:hypothetical protein [Rhodospirillaceae bacterium]
MSEKKEPAISPISPADKPATSAPTYGKTTRLKEIGGPKGPEPTRYGDWEQNGRCTDF